jgi:osmoprotectant transport system permease protein
VKARNTLLLVFLLALGIVPLPEPAVDVRVGSKKFTESVILGEMFTMLVKDAGPTATHYRELGGTRILFDALVNGEIDAYPEYTGTLIKEIFADQPIADTEQLGSALASQGIRMSRPLGFNNTYALGMRREQAERLGVKTISDLLRHPDLQFGFSNEFMDRSDGWPNLRRRYGLPQTRVQGLDHDLAYQQLQLGAIDVIDVYSTDARIHVLDLQVLGDDLEYFSRYDAVLLYRDPLQKRFPGAVRALLRLEDRFSEAEMIRINGRTEVEGIPESTVAADFLAREFDLHAEVREITPTQRILDKTVEHLDLVRRSLIPAIFLAVPIGILAARLPRFGQLILSLVGLVQTIPALALLVMLMPLMVKLELSSVGTGSATAIVALFLYSLLPIVRNTHAGVQSIPLAYRESAAALGLSWWYCLTRIDLPLASPGILAGIKTAAVMNVGFATLGALIGAGGYGQPILTGIRLADTGLILQGAVPAAAMALLVQGSFDLAELLVVPKGLRLKGSSD